MLIASRNIQIAQPVPDTLVSATDGRITLAITNPGADPSRSLTVSVNESPVLSWVGGSILSLNSDYTLSVASITGATQTFSLQKVTSWSDPQTLNVVAVYEPFGTLAGRIETASTALVATFEFVSQTPAANEFAVNYDTSITLAAASSANITGATVRVNNAQAVRTDISELWNKPNFTGYTTLGEHSVFAHVTPRRFFNSDSSVTIQLICDLTADGTYTLHHAVAYKFFISDAVTSAALSTDRIGVDRPFLGHPASDTLRVALLGAIRTPGSNALSDVLVYHRIVRSSLNSVRVQFQRPDLDAEIENIPARDIPDVIAVATALALVDIIWEPALHEAVILGVDPRLVDLLARTHTSNYPQERVAAVACLVFAISAFTT